MKVTFENPDKINGLMTLVVEENDYKEGVEKTLKNYRKKANVPGFRPGMVPMGMIKKQYGTAVKVDEINRLVGENIYKYVQDNNIAMLGEPLPNAKQEQQDLSGDGPFTFIFDIAVAPEVNIELNDKDKIHYYKIKVDDKLIDEQVEAYTARAGHNEKVDAYDPEQRDLLRGDLVEVTAKGNKKKNGLVVENVPMMPQFIKVDEQKAKFDGCKIGDSIIFNPKKAYPDNDSEIASMLKMKKEEVGNITSDFSYHITEISRFVKAEVNQQLFDQLFGEGVIKSEEDFRKRIAEDLEAQFAGNSEYRFMLDLRQYAEKKVGELTFPEDILKRVMKNNNKDREEDFVDKNFEGSLKELKWHIIKEKLATAHNIKIEHADIKNAAKETARAQFAQYGMSNVPDEYLENYADELLKKQEQAQAFVDRALEQKLSAALKSVVKLTEKKVSLEDFNKLFEEK